MTMGDAVASFLYEKDIETSDMDLRKLRNAKKCYSSFDTAYDPSIRRWKDDTSKKWRAFTLILYRVHLSSLIALADIRTESQ